jgi:signal transduction histidine kinase
MRERAEEIGGTFQVDTTLGHGTRVRVQLSRR